MLCTPGLYGVGVSDVAGRSELPRAQGLKCMKHIFSLLLHCTASAGLTPVLEGALCLQV